MAKSFVVNGEIYVKNGPNSIEDIIHDLEFETSLERFDIEKTKELSFFQSIFNSGKKYDFSYTTDFWQLTTNGEIYQLNCIKYNGDVIQTLEFSSKEELEKEFTSLHDFLNTATFVGKEFNRTKPIISELTNKDDISYMSQTSIPIHPTKYIVLYATQDLFLIKEIDYYFGERYDLINSRYTLDGNYIFHGQTYNEYKDKNKVYKEIFEQIEYSKIKRKKK